MIAGTAPVVWQLWTATIMFSANSCDRKEMQNTGQMKMEESRLWPLFRCFGSGEGLALKILLKHNSLTLNELDIVSTPDQGDVLHYSVRTIAGDERLSSVR